MAIKDLLITQELVDHMKAAFQPVTYKPGMTLDEVAWNAAKQEPIQHLERLLQKRIARSR